MDETPMDLTEPMDLEVKQGVLSDLQTARLITLTLCKPLLTGTGLASKTPPAVEDLIRLAEWALSGESEDLYPYLQADGTVQLGPNVTMQPDGYVVIKDSTYEPVQIEEMPSA